MSSRVVVFGDVQEAQSDPTAKQETTDHTQWDKEGKLVTVDPARRRREREEERGRERENSSRNTKSLQNSNISKLIQKMQ